MSEIRCRCRSFTKWTLKDESPKYAPDRSCDVVHLQVKVEPDLPRRAISATATLRLAASYGPFESIRLDAVDLDIHSVQDGRGRDLSFTYLDDQLVVRFSQPVTSSEDLVITYRKEKPLRGLYFWGPTEWAPERDWQLWSQGEDEEARHWIPCHDAPNEKMTTEMIVTVPNEYTVISNGELRGRTTRAKKSTWHFFESVPHPSYLISLVVGVFSKLEDDCDGLPVEYYVEPGREEEGFRSFGKTPEMIRCFSELLACPFPYEKYAQVAVRHFTFGGMENTSATTQTDGTLHDAAAALEYSSDALVSHELAHQWFGDLLTCKHWAHAWLNEGFATYFECIWREHGESFAEFEKNLLDDADAYFAEPYRRAIVNHKFAYPFQLFDMHLYPKGGWVLHMLRRKVGDDLFWKAVRLYVRRHAASTVETIDLMRAFEDATGQNLEGFFHQWLFSPGHPELAGSIRWNEETSMLEIRLEQKQKQRPRPKQRVDDGIPIFQIPIEVEVRIDTGGTGRSGRATKTPARRRSENATSAGAGAGASGSGPGNEGGTRVVRIFEMTLREQTFYLPLPAKPTWVLLDPNARVLKTLELEFPTDWMRAALIGPAQDSRVFARTQLVRRAAKDPSLRVVQMLGEVLRKDPFWSVQQEAATALGKIRTPEARAELVRSIAVPHPKARRAVVSALGSFQDDVTAQALEAKVRKGDKGYQVRMEALSAYGRAAGAPAAPLLRKELHAALKRRDWHDLVAVGAVAGLVHARDESAIDDILALATDPTRYWGSRLNAFASLAKLGASRPHLAARIFDAIRPHLDDPELRVAFGIPSALAGLGHADAIPALQAKASSSPTDEQRDACLRAIESLSASGGSGAQVDRLQSEVHRLEEESRTLRERIDRMEELSGAKATNERAAARSKPARQHEGAAPKTKPAKRTRRV